MKDAQKLTGRDPSIWLTLISAAIYISLTFNRNVWMDEAFTATLIRTDYAGVLERSMNDTLPPLYNLLLKLATDIFGYHVPVMKLLSAFFLILTIALGGSFVKKRFGMKASAVFILALTLMPNMQFFGVEIRMYSLGFFFSTMSGLLAYDCISRSDFKSFALFSLTTALSGYSHHFALVTSGFVCLFMLIWFLAVFFMERKGEAAGHRAFSQDPGVCAREGLRRLFLCFLSILVLYLPCFIVTLKQLKRVSGYFSMPEITPSVFVKYMRYPFTVGFTPLSLLLLFTAAALFLRLVYRLLSTTRPAKEMEPPCDLLLNLYSLACFMVYYGVLLFGTLISKIMTANIFVDRYLFFALGLLWLFFSIEASTLKKPLYVLIIILELLVGVVTLGTAYRSEYAEGADELIDWLNENVSEGDLLYTLEDAEGLSLSLPFYDERLTNYEELSEIKAHTEGGGTVNIWCAILDGYEVKPQDTRGFELEPQGAFSFDRYKFTMYRMIPVDTD